MVTTPTRPREFARNGSGPTRASASAGVLVGFLAIAFAVAAFGTITTIGSINGWYAHSARVLWTPPNAVFPIVWTILYAMIGVSGWLAWRQRDRAIVTPGLTLFVVQLALNSLWTPVFFGGYPIMGSAALWVAMAVIIAMDLAVAATIVSFWQYSRAASLLLVPYLAWILYASSLNWGDAVLNALG